MYRALKALVVEDNQHMRTIVNTILSGVNLKSVREARDGAEALDILKQFPADLAIVDYNMAPIDGIEFVLMLRNAPDSPNKYLPVIMITGHSERSRVEKARDSGINEFVVKPLTANALLSRLNSVVNYPRSFVRTASYFGPDRRRRSADNYTGPYRRDSDGLI